MSRTDDDNIKLLKAIGKTFKMMTMTIKDEMDRHALEMTREQGMVLRKLELENGIIQNDLAWVTFRDKTSLARLLSKMEHNGHIRREADPDDRRAKRVFLTKKGLQLRNKVNTILAGLAQRFEKDIDQQNIEQTVLTLRAIQKNLDNDFEI